MTVGQNIRAIRKEKGLTQKQLGELCGIAESNIRKYEADKQKPKIETIDRIAQALGVPIARIKEDLTFDEHKGTDELKRLDQAVQLRLGIEAAIAEIYGGIEEKFIYSKTGWGEPYFLVGKVPNTFVLFDNDIDALAQSVKAAIPALVERMKDTRPEAEIAQEMHDELSELEAADSILLELGARDLPHWERQKILQEVIAKRSSNQ